MKHTKPLMTLLITAFLLASLSGCATTRTASLPPSDPVQSLVSRPDFEQARTCAKEWVRQALHMIEDLNARVKELQVAKPGQ